MRRYTMRSPLKRAQFSCFLRRLAMTAPSAMAIALVLGIARPAGADLESKINEVSKHIVIKIGNQASKIAVVDIVDVNEKPDKLGELIGELLSTSLVNVLPPGLGLLERRELRQLLATQSLQSKDLFDETKRAEIGKLLPADAIVVGKHQCIGNTIWVNIAVVEVQTARKIAGKIIKLRKDDALDQPNCQSSEPDGPHQQHGEVSEDDPLDLPTPNRPQLPSLDTEDPILVEDSSGPNWFLIVGGAAASVAGASLDLTLKRNGRLETIDFLPVAFYAGSATLVLLGVFD